jgi:hypothetical protein
MAIDTKSIKVEGDKAVFRGYKMEVYIPISYFESESAYIMSNTVVTLGIFIVKTYSSETSSGATGRFLLPFTINTIPDKMENVTAELYGSTDNYKKLTYYNGDVFIDNVNAIAKLKNLVDFIGMIHSGKVPKFIDYKDVAKIEMDLMELNSSSLGVNFIILHLIISEIYRQKNDITKPFRFSYKADKVNELDYMPINLVDIPRVSSTFTALSFQDMDFAIISSVNKYRNNVADVESPVEKVIKY